LVEPGENILDRDLLSLEEVELRPIEMPPWALKSSGHITGDSHTVLLRDIALFRDGDMWFDDEVSADSEKDKVEEEKLFIEASLVSDAEREREEKHEFDAVVEQKDKLSRLFRFG